MMKSTFRLILILIFLISQLSAQEVQQLENRDYEIPVTILGTFHFAYPNRDRIVTEANKQVDILSEQRQRELQELLDKLSGYKPTIVAVEVMTEKQPYIDSLYAEYLAGRYQPAVNEVYQIGFRLARRAGLKRVYCIDTWGDYERYITRDTFWVHYENWVNAHPFDHFQKPVQQYNDTAVKMTLTDFYRYANSPQVLKMMQSAYFLGGFMFEENPGDFAGTDWVTSQWYNRNLRIVRNLMRVPAGPDDRIFILYGNGHHALLRDYLEYAPFYRYVPVGNFL